MSALSFKLNTASNIKYNSILTTVQQYNFCDTFLEKNSATNIIAESETKYYE